MIYLLVGQDHLAKEQKIAEIKIKALPSKESLSFDYQVLHGYKLDNEALKKALMALPVVGHARVILFRQTDELTAAQKTIIVNAYAGSEKNLILIFEAEGLDDKDVLYKKFGQAMKVFSFSPKSYHNVFDLMRVILMSRKAEALELLDELLKAGDHPLQIVGGMLWAWRNAKNKMAAVKFKKGLTAFEQADFYIKRSQLKGEHALEVLVVKLCL
jgi:DNA polymerase III delta subunit